MIGRLVLKQAVGQIVGLLRSVKGSFPDMMYRHFLVIISNSDFFLVPTGPPRNVYVVSLSDTRIFASWDPPDVDEQNGIITEYIVEYSVMVNEYKRSKETKTNTLRTVISGLKASENYAVRVAAKNSAGIGPFSVEIRLDTMRQSS